MRGDGERVLMGLVQRGLLDVRPNGEVWRTAACGRTGRWRQIAPVRADKRRADGYRVVRVQIDGRAHMAMAHRLVWAVHVGPVPPGEEINHRNGCRGDNRLENLERVSPSRNVQHSYDVLGRPRAAGSRNGRAKLTREQVGMIRQRAAGGEAGRALAREFGVSHTVVQRIIAGRYWRDEMPERAR